MPIPLFAIGMQLLVPILGDEIADGFTKLAPSAHAPTHLEIVLDVPEAGAPAGSFDAGDETSVAFPFDEAGSAR